MKRKLILSLACVLAVGQINIIAKEDQGTEITSGEYENGNGYWDFGNSLSKEAVYNGYSRDGEFKIFNFETNQLLNADRFTVRNGIYYFRVNGSDYAYDRHDENMWMKECTSVQGKKLHLSENVKLYSEPFFDESLLVSDYVPAGEYEAIKRTFNFVLIQLEDGSTGWVGVGYRETEEDEGYYVTNSYFVDTKSELSVQNVNGIPVKTWMIPNVDVTVRSKLPQVPLYVTIHNTANEEVGANAYAHAKHQATHLNIWTSWHFSVDDHEIYQSIPMNEVAYHAGDGVLLGNSATIAIEICENSDGNYAQAERNAAYLTARILYDNGLPSHAIRMHRDWSGKNCPRNIINGTKGTMGWSAFQKLVADEYQRIVEENEPKEEIKPEIEAFLKKAGLKVSEGIISGIQQGITVQQLLEQLNQLEEGIKVSFENHSNGDVVATGFKMMIQTNNFTQVFPCSIKGDVNGDGKISSMDYSLVKNYILKISVLSKDKKIAANINEDSKISSIDYAMIKNHILGISTINK